MEIPSTYRAVQAVSPGRLELMQKTLDVTTDLRRDTISNALADLQRVADTFSLPHPTSGSVITLRVVFVAGAASAWRLIETVRSKSSRRRQMLCFDSLDQLSRAVEERMAWQRADEQFVATYMATPAGSPGVTPDWVHSMQFDSFFGPSRDAIRKELCTTLPEHTVTFADATHG